MTEWNTPELWRILVPLLIAHLLSDFVLQTKTMVIEKDSKQLKSIHLYVHACIAGAAAYLLVATWTLHFIFWVTAGTHLLIDAWKSSHKNSDSATLFLTDQFLHLSVIAGLCVWVIGWDASRDVLVALPWREISLIGLGFLFLTRPASIIIQKLISKWDYGLKNGTLPGAGHYIGILERTLLYVFILFNQFAAIGLLIAAKSLLRYGSKSQEREETEYILVGTLLSFTVAILAGLVIRFLL